MSAAGNLPKRRHTEVLGELLALEGSRIVDIGCGSGSLVRALARRGARMTGVEPQAARVAEAEAEPRLADERYLTAGAEALPLADGSQDAAIFFNSLHHVPAALMDRALAEAQRVLAADGRLCIVEPLAEGASYEFGRPIDDERAVRAEAYAALRRAADGPGWRQERELFYDTEVVYADFEAAARDFEKVDPRRAPQIAAIRSDWEKAFRALGRETEKGWVFSQPMRANLLVRR
ncbi:pimeloyl-CoA biosynthesis protein BioC [Tistlia consotensis]|uniref:Pimeloyl-CoA biosynthesis protein BioC n=1 Tax=Tistlia consotensis USBA 355 TaxID=560819 RepID=A0A1Y6CNL2_9PROT|nr:class I SAM-dependent methyltransferase [Tistlia consotensis]SMF62430.1 pimeloyl-CoA biosynthesis protein BioC [Tistlia consotensis USBA 355]SNR94697.1 pimeloyl-CoA biosynthesis protein BioC [Tistlia consotensis]